MCSMTCVCEVRGRIYARHCGLFWNKHWVLVVVDSHPHGPIVYDTTSADDKFSITALRKTFSREGMPQVLKANSPLRSPLGIEYHQLLAPPRHLQSNGLAEKKIRILKYVIKSLNPSTIPELERGVGNSSLQYRNATNGTTRARPVQLFESQTIRSKLR